MSESKIINLSEAQNGNPAPPILLSAEEQKKREAARQKQKAEDDKQFEKESKAYLGMLEKYQQLFLGALEKGEDIFANLNTAWKMRCTMNMAHRTQVNWNPLDFEKAIDYHKSVAAGIPPLAEAVTRLERKLSAIESLLNLYSDKEHVLWRNIHEALFPKPPVQAEKQSGNDPQQ